MLRRTIGKLFMDLPRSKRVNVGEALAPKQQIFSRAKPVHMYANKETGSQGVINIDRPEVTWERMKITGKRVWSDRVSRYYFGTSLVVVFLAWEYIQFQYTILEEQAGCIGPKRKNYQSRLTVVLDVDETLISFGDKAFRLKGSVKPRPYLAELLDYCSKIDAEVILWSAGSDRYMRAVLMAIDPAGLRVDHFLSREGQWFVNDTFYEKNLAWLKRPTEDIIFVENRPMSIRSCNKNSILVEDFIRAEYMDTGRDFPLNDHALKTVKEIIQELHESGKPVPEYLADKKARHKEIKSIPCHLAMRQMPDELAVGEFYFIGDKYKPTKEEKKEIANAVYKAFR
jgi:hypothetical protein